MDYMKILPERLLKRRVSMESLGVMEAAWHYEDAMEAIDIIAQEDIVILGGDVLVANSDLLQYTYDSWYMSDDLLVKENCRNISIEKAREYINWYLAKFGQGFLYSLVCAEYK